MTSLSFSPLKPLSRIGLAALAGAALFSIFPQEASAQYVWTRNAAGTYDWNTAAYWSGSNLPPTTTDSLVTITNVTTLQTIRLTGNQTLNGGFTQNHRSTVNLNLQGHTLTIADTWLLGVTASDNLTGGVFSTYSNGTVQMGTEEKAAVFNAFTSSINAPAARSLVFAAGSTFDSFNLSEFSIIKNPGSANRNQVGTVDFSAATLRSGAESHALIVDGAVTIASISAANSSVGTLDGKGTLLLPSTIAKISMGSLLVGKNASTGGANGYYNTVGTLDLGGGSAVDMSVAGDFILGQGDYVSGSITNLPEVLNLSIGSAESNGKIWIGYKDTSHTNAAVKDHDNLGTLTSRGGTFTAHATELRIGQNNRPGGTATGILDMSAATLDELVISGATVIGSGTNASGRLLLKEGSASSASLTVGKALGTPAQRSLLSLNETTFTTASLNLGAWGDIAITVGSASSGLDLTGTTFLIDEGGTIDINFTEYQDLWGLRMSGDYQALFNQYFTDGWLKASGAYQEMAQVYFDGTHTYFGIAVPEPSSFLLLGGGAAAVYAMGRRRNKTSI